MIQKYLKLRTIRILREKHLHRYTCHAVTNDIWLAKAKWYIGEVKRYASLNSINGLIPFYELASRNNTTSESERLKFLNQLEQLVLKGQA